METISELVAGLSNRRFVPEEHSLGPETERMDSGTRFGYLVEAHIREIFDGHGATHIEPPHPLFSQQDKRFYLSSPAERYGLCYVKKSRKLQLIDYTRLDGAPVLGCGFSCLREIDFLVETPSIFIIGEGKTCFNTNEGLLQKKMRETLASLENTLKPIYSCLPQDPNRDHPKPIQIWLMVNRSYFAYIQQDIKTGRFIEGTGFLAKGNRIIGLNIEDSDHIPYRQQFRGPFCNWERKRKRREKRSPGKNQHGEPTTPPA